MRTPFLPLLIAFLIAAGIDCYLYFAIQRLALRRFWSELQLWSAVLCLLVIIGLFVAPKKSISEEGFRVLMWIIFVLCSIYVPKAITVIFDLVSSIPKIWSAGRWIWLDYTGVVLASLSFLMMWWGAFINRYRLHIKDVDIEITSLPKSFDGYRIAQISDLHVGSFASDTMFVSKLVDSINAQNADIIVFTGDIVNRSTSELEPFLKTLSRLHARHGVYSVLGNHDYGDYNTWPSVQAKKDNLRQLVQWQREIGWHVLNNSTRWLRHGNDSIALIGVENVGDPPFRTYGDLRKAYPDISDLNTKILLTHNPAHWVADLSDNPSANIALTLSGHTHAMQMELFGLSPAALRYPTWGGLYTDSIGRYLYVNIGCGEVGFPARIGATPENTILTLRRK